MDLKLYQTQNLELKLTNEMLTSIELLELNSLEIDSLILKEAEENILIDYEKRENDINIENFIKGYKKNKNIYEEPTEDENDYTQTITYIEDFREEISKDYIEQKLTTEEKNIGLYIINNLDDRGYLTISLNKIAEKLKCEVHDIYQILKKIWQLEPKGIGARNLKECLTLQTEDEKIKNIIDKYLDDILNNRLNQIAKKENTTIEEIQKIIEEIKKLNPIPTSGYNNNEITKYIYPEIFVIEKEDKQLEIIIQDSRENKVNLNNYYITLYETTQDEELKKYLEKKYKKALFFLESIAKRRATIKKVVKTIVEFQEIFFKYNGPLKPLNLEIIAKQCNISKSTVSRTLKNKYIQSKRGIQPLRYFLINEIANTKESKDEIIKLIEKLIKNENKKKPLTDKKIEEELQQRGINLKRRTIAKYREQLNIPKSNIRRQY